MTSAAPRALPSNADAPSGPWRCVSIDVEDYFQIEAAYHAIPRDAWDLWPSRVEANVDHLLELFNQRGQRGTFFVLGCVAAQFGGMVRRIADAGHEIASHGTGHDRLHRLGPDGFREDLVASKKTLEDLVGEPVLGYRAPTFSVTHQTHWAIDVMLEAGLVYDASIFPVTHPAYGVPEAPDEPYHVQSAATGRTLLELPPLTWRVMRRNVAVAGGGYFRILPLWFMKQGLRQAERENRPAVLYFHPWEFDPELPRMPLSRTGLLRTYTGLKRASARLDSIMRLPGRWAPIREALPELRARADQREPFVLTPATSEPAG